MPEHLVDHFVRPPPRRCNKIQQTCEQMQLKLSQNDISKYADRYDFSDQDLVNIKPAILDRGYLTRDDLSKVAIWKAPRAAGHIKKNSSQYVEEITKFSLSANIERSKIESLTLLDGVAWPTASVILHFFNDNPYPILDFRALWSLGVDVPNQYNFVFWWNYTIFCRKLSKNYNISMRTLDKALWQFSKENQE